MRIDRESEANHDPILRLPYPVMVTMKQTLKSIWRGESPLWKVFWLFFIGGYFLLLLINLILTGIVVDHFEFVPLYFLAIFLFSVTFAFLIISFYAIKRCSKNVKWGGWVWISQSIVLLFIIRNFYSLYVVLTQHIPEINKTKDLLTNG
jgi:hypothetical protein